MKRFKITGKLNMDLPDDIFYSLRRIPIYYGSELELAKENCFDKFLWKIEDAIQKNVSTDGNEVWDDEDDDQVTVMTSIVVEEIKEDQQ